MPTASEKDLNTLFKLLNTDIGSMEGDSLRDLIHELAIFQTVEGVYPNLLEFTKHYERLAGKVGFESSQEAVLDRKKFLAELQAHVRSRVEQIISIADGQKRGVLLEILGTVDVVIENDRFWEEVKRDVVVTDPLEEEKVRFDTRLVDLLQHLDLRPSRFRKCVRCGNYFYQESERERLYCSIKCSAAVRQGKYLASRKQGKKQEGKRRKKNLSPGGR